MFHIRHLSCCCLGHCRKIPVVSDAPVRFEFLLSCGISVSRSSHHRCDLTSRRDSRLEDFSLHLFQLVRSGLLDVVLFPIPSDSVLDVRGFTSDCIPCPPGLLEYRAVPPLSDWILRAVRLPVGPLVEIEPA